MHFKPIAVSLLLALSAVAVAPAEASVVREWNEEALAAIRAGAPRPTVVSRSLFLLSAAKFDAYAAFDATALASTPQNRALRQPVASHSEQNRSIAASHAAYTILVDQMPAQKQRFDDFMQALGLDPADTSTGSAAAVGRQVALNVLQARADDGSNPAANYADIAGTTFPIIYANVNGADPTAANAPGYPLFNPNRWQPLRVPNGSVRDASGYPIADPEQPSSYADQKFLTPHWGAVRPFAAQSVATLLPPPPPQHGSDAPYTDALGATSSNHEAWLRQYEEVRQISAELDDFGKVSAEFWADGPRSETPPGHWNQLAQGVSLRDGHDIAADATMFLALNAAMMDSGIVTWYTKRVYDSTRPVSAIRHMYYGETIESWAGPNLGTQAIAGEHWMPYQEATFITPPFAEYTSGHSGFSAAAATVLEGLTGSGQFFDGSSRIDRDLDGDGENDLLGQFIANPGYLRFEEGPGAPVTLRWETFRDAADEAGFSRLYGGIHIQDGDLRGREIGDAVGARALQRVQALVAGRLPLSPAFAGVWFAPERSGEGFSVHIDTDLRLVLQWNTYDNDGRQMWLAGLGEVADDGSIRVPLVVTEGARFGMAFNPADVSQTPFGELSLTFTACNSARIDYTPALTGYDSGGFEITRLLDSSRDGCTAQ